MKLLLSALVVFHLLLPLKGSSLEASAKVPEQSNPSFSAVSAAKRSIGENHAAFGGEAALRWSHCTPFAELAPRQKIMGVINTIAVLRTKAALLDEMKHAFEPRTTAKSPGIVSGGSLPGPALAYGDCRLGILPFEVCRHLGFLDSDPMVAPSSTQSKLLRLVGASSLVASYKKGQAHLNDDPHLNSVLGPQLVDYAVRALTLFWNSQLLSPAFDARGVNTEQVKQALYYADAFLFQTATQAKHIIRFNRSEYDDVASWLALLFSDAEPNASAHREGDPQRVEEDTRVEPSATAAKPQAKENDFVVRSKTPTNQQGKEGVTARPTHAPVPGPSSQKEEEGGMFGGFLSRFFTSQAPKPSHSPSGSSLQQSTQLKNAEPETAPINSFSAFATSVGEGLTSIVTSTARGAAKFVQGESHSAPPPKSESIVDKLTEERVSNILDALPENVNGQFR
ncbi:hypothetical protein, conserved [Eimeria maxima]|uniref:Uncharacterized protein n=1 Tax=Eimeria maxima TaxID=5804 RepID=U6M5N4_EIMMA|nr:hypothetical protein, conserved [Eimeria maxima]CDJ59341.1 hypothetical protein, conserved [Eimeria maxima]